MHDNVCHCIDIVTMKEAVKPKYINFDSIRTFGSNSLALMVGTVTSVNHAIWWYVWKSKPQIWCQVDCVCGCLLITNSGKYGNSQKIKYERSAWTNLTAGLDKYFLCPNDFHFRRSLKSIMGTWVAINSLFVKKSFCIVVVLDLYHSNQLCICRELLL